MNGTRSILVVGGASGIGRSTAEQAAQDGWHVTVLDVAPHDPETWGGYHVRYRQGNALSPIAMQDAVADSAPDGRLQALVHTAGLQIARPIKAGTFGESDLRRMLEVNVESAWHAVEHALPALRDQALSTGVLSSVVLCSSLAARKGQPALAAYGATKGAVEALARGLAVELAPRGVRVNALAPGWTDTGFNAPVEAWQAHRAEIQERRTMSVTADEIKARNAAQVPLGRQADPDEIARCALWLADDGSSYVTGAVLAADGGLGAC